MEYQLVSEWERVFANINELDDNSYSTIKEHLCYFSREDKPLSIVSAQDLDRIAGEYCGAIKKFEEWQEIKIWKQILQEVLMEHKLDEKQLVNGISDDIDHILMNASLDDLGLELTVDREDLEVLVYSYWKLLEMHEETYRRYQEHR
ncbi:hypothetical protein ACQKNO_24715 [Bacillus paramycoides]|uniref:hypothetical protein n=1 Tax=Bacillus paramycoides TaxID=2026194 RepID=UPI003CFEA087